MLFNYDDWGKSGTLGDTFGILNALFSSIGTAGIIYTIYIQNDTIKSQDRILELQAKTFEISIKPLMELVPQGEDNDDFKVIVSNIGNGTAINIEVVPTRMTLVEGQKYFYFKSTEKKKFTLRTNESKLISIRSYDENNDEYLPIFNAVLEEEHTNTTVEFTIQYQDVNFTKWKQKFRLGIDDRTIEMAEL